jgi:dienelactone hydrolase
VAVQLKDFCLNPQQPKKVPGIIVVHENRGLNPYIEDVGRRAAVDGFITLAPDALSPLGGYPGMMMRVENYKKTNSGGNARTSLQPTTT